MDYEYTFQPEELKLMLLTSLMLVISVVGLKKQTTSISVSCFKTLHEILKVINILHCLMFYQLVFVTLPLLNKEKEMTMSFFFFALC